MVLEQGVICKLPNAQQLLLNRFYFYGDFPVEHFTTDRCQHYSLDRPKRIHDTTTFADLSKRVISTQPPAYKYFSAFPPITATTSSSLNTFGTSS
jgi:hypothetical protein